MSSIFSSSQPSGVGGRGEHGLGQVGAPDRLAGGDTSLDLRFVQLEAELLERRGHPQRALLAVGEELGELLGEDRAGVVDAVTEDVQFAWRLRVCIDRGDLDRGDHAHAVTLARAQRLGDAGNGVVVAQREQLHPGARCALHHLGGLERAVGVGGMGLQVEADRHRAGAYRCARGPVRRAQELAGSRAAPGAASSAATWRPNTSRSVRTATR